MCDDQWHMIKIISSHFIFLFFRLIFTLFYFSCFLVNSISCHHVKLKWGRIFINITKRWYVSKSPLYVHSAPLEFPFSIHLYTSHAHTNLTVMWTYKMKDIFFTFHLYFILFYDLMTKKGKFECIQIIIDEIVKYRHWKHKLYSFIYTYV